MRTKLDRYLREHQISTARLVSESRRHDPRRRGYSRNHLYSIRRGESEPTRTCIAVVLAAVRAIARDPRLTADDLFDFGQVVRRKAAGQ